MESNFVRNFHRNNRYRMHAYLVTNHVVNVSPKSSYKSAILNLIRSGTAAECIKKETLISRQLKLQNKTNSENGHLVFSIFKKKQENNGVGDISSLCQRHCQTNDLYGIKTKYYRLRCFLVFS